MNRVVLFVAAALVVAASSFAQGVLKLQSMTMADTVYTVKSPVDGNFVFKHCRADSYQLRLVGTKAYFESKVHAAPMTVSNISITPLTATETLGSNAPQTSMSGNPPSVTITPEMLSNPVRDNTTREEYYVVIYSGLKTTGPARVEGSISNF
ncbi:MAG TPA: hypothetical protein VFO76_09570 [Candidatus Kapabacteria bacterium]|nr:hypothetical protein [Candidatus Kapabacteria bacterium]